MDIVKLGVGKVYDSDGNRYTIPQAEIYRDTDDQDEREPFGSLGIACALGVTALPAPPTMNDNGGVTAQAEGVLGPRIGGSNGSVVAAWDTRCADVVGKMSAGDSALHGTHADASKRAVYFAKENLAAITVGNDVAITVDRAAKDISITGFGMKVEMSETNGIMLCGTGGAYIQIKDGAVNIVGNVAFGNNNPATKGAVAVMTGAGPAASLSVFTNG